MCENVARLFGNVLLNVFCIYLYPAWFRHRNVYQSFGKAHKNHTRNLYNLIFSTICETGQSGPNARHIPAVFRLLASPQNIYERVGEEVLPKGGLRALNSRIVRLEVAHDDLVNVTASLGHQLGLRCELIPTLSLTCTVIIHLRVVAIK